jgi:uncharacterized protein (TIGR03086 family)
VSTVQSDHLALLSRVVEQSAASIAAITPEQRTRSTPCADWDMRTLVTHVVEDARRFTLAAQGEKIDWSQPPQPLDGDDWAAEFGGNAQQMLDAWRAAPAERVPDAAQAITELAIHSWDLAKATGQSTAVLDDEVAEFALAYTRPLLKPEYRGAGGGGAFGEEVPVPADAPAQDRLAGWFGREPSWSPPG